MPRRSCGIAFAVSFWRSVRMIILSWRKSIIVLLCTSTRSPFTQFYWFSNILHALATWAFTRTEGISSCTAFVCQLSDMKFKPTCKCLWPRGKSHQSESRSSRKCMGYTAPTCSPYGQFSTLVHFSTQDRVCGEHPALGAQ